MSLSHHIVICEDFTGSLEYPIVSSSPKDAASEYLNKLHEDGFFEANGFPNGEEITVISNDKILRKYQAEMDVKYFTFVEDCHYEEATNRA